MEKTLLIIGAGGHGKVVREIASSMHENEKPVYSRIDFLDDHAPEAIGKTEDMAQFRNQYTDLFCAIGNNGLRYQFLQQAKGHGYVIPVLIHPTAYVSPSAEIGDGTVIEPNAVVNANSQVGVGGIISVGAIVDHDTTIGTCVHVNAGAIVKAGAKVEALRKIDAGQIIEGF